MLTTLLSALARLSAGALLLQAGIPAAMPLKAAHKAAQEGERFAAIRSEASRLPKPMKGVPRVTEVLSTGVVHPVRLPRVGEPGHSLLGPAPTLRVEVSRQTQKAWRIELAERPAPAREARLRIQLGEILIDAHEPTRAQAMLDRAATLVSVESPDRGLARFEAALALFLQGRYTGATAAFRHLATGPLQGVDRRGAMFYARESAACEGYHAAHERLGIPEPSRLDPLCGVASLATCLRGLGMTYGRKEVAQAVRHDGEGSSNLDLVRSLPTLGLMGRELTADERGLIALPKPLVAHVEHDHFVAVVEADRKGIEYVCSDCGAWPGGPVRLTWKQWREMSADRLLAVARPGTAAALAIQSLPTDRLHGAGHAWVASRRVENPGVVAAAERILAAVGTSAVAQNHLPINPAVYCAMRMYMGHCLDCEQNPPMNAGGPGSPFGSNDPVDIATGEEEYGAPGGLSVYNPIGPSVSWGLKYFSLANVAMTGFGAGWTHPYNYRFLNGKRSAFQDPDSTAPPVIHQTSYLILPNSARVTFVQDALTPPDASTPVVHLSVPAGYPYLVDWCYDTASGSIYYVVTTKDRSRWTFRSVNSGFFCPVRIEDRMGNSINLAWVPKAYNTLDELEGGAGSEGLVSISDSSNVALLTVNYASSGRVTSVVDRYGRKVIYGVSTYNYANIPAGVSPTSCDELTAISQVTASTASTALVRAVYDYANVSNQDGPETVPVLNTIKVPSPTGTGLSTATIGYDATGGVRGSTDANGNVVSYGPLLSGGTTVLNVARVKT